MIGDDVDDKKKAGRMVGDVEVVWSVRAGAGDGHVEGGRWY